MRRFNVSIQRSELLTIPDQVGEWEIPILQLVHGPEAVAISTSVKDANSYPAASVEYERLERRYGENPATGTSRVAEVYGPAPGGVRILHQAIKEAALEHERAVTEAGDVLGDELNEEIAPPTAEVTAVASSTPATPVEIAKEASKAKAKQAAPKKQIIGKQPAKPAVVPTPKQPTESLAAPVAIEE